MTYINYDFAVLSVLAAERKALDTVLCGSITERLDHPTLGEVLTVSIEPISPSRRPLQGLVVSIPSAGRVEAALTAATALEIWRPRYVVLVGVAGGFKARGVEMGDILVSTDIVDCAIQKAASPDFIIRPRRFSISESLLRIAKTIPTVSGYEFWYESLLVNSCVHFGPIASGDIVVASSHLVESLLSMNSLLIGIEMEAAGVAAAVAHSNTLVELIEIRGVADLADEHKADEWVNRSCYAAAHFAGDLLRRLSI
jgi:nucleoside phosphorylase